jgi:hypothetical protein
MPAITPPQLSRRRSHVIDEWQMHLNKSIAGIAHCKYLALVLLFYLASLQPPFNFLRAVRAASLSVTYGPTLLIYFNFYCRLPAPPLRHRRLRPKFSAVGKIALAHRHRHVRPRHHATGNITTHTIAGAPYASTYLRPPSHGRSPPEFWPFLPVLGSLWFSIQPQNYFS